MMMKKLFLFLLISGLTGSLFAQKKTTTSATVKFDASTSIDALPKAENKTVVAAINTSTGTIAFEAAVKNFAFSNPMMQDHFNGANWMNSDKFPSFSYAGSIADLSKVNFAKDGTYNVTTVGTLSIRGVDQKITTPATIVVRSGKITASADFTVKLSDFGITGVPIDAGKVSKEPKINVSAELK
jgi:polyisoprenoid-binding protein YceI